MQPQVVTQYSDHDVPHVLEACERMEAHLTAAGARAGAGGAGSRGYRLPPGTQAHLRSPPPKPPRPCLLAPTDTHTHTRPAPLAVVSNDVRFTQHILGSTVNGTTYAGIRARTTGAPQNHWFGPAGDPRAAGIGTPEAIRLVWSTHRCAAAGGSLLRGGDCTRGCSCRQSSASCLQACVATGALLLRPHPDCLPSCRPPPPVMAAARSSRTSAPCRTACSCSRAER